jgi:hypothetical protein
VRWARYVALIGEMRNADSILTGKPEENRPLCKTRNRWEDNIRIDMR